jgi:hypothetical protein
VVYTWLIYRSVIPEIAMYTRRLAVLCEWARLITWDSSITDAMYNHGRRHIYQCVCTPVITPAMPQIDMDAKIDKWLCSISMPLVYARISIHSYGGQLDRGLMKETSSRRLRGRPKERRVRKIVLEVRILFLGSYRYHPFSEALHHWRDDPAYECYSLGKTYVWSKCLRC